MNTKVNLKKGYKGKIIKVLHVTGLLTFSDMNMLIENSEKIEMYYRSAHELEKEGYVKLGKSNGEKYIRLSLYRSHEEEYRRSIGNAYVEYYLKTYDNLHMFQETTKNRSKLTKEEKEKERDKRTDNNKKLAEATTRLIMFLGGYVRVDKIPVWNIKENTGMAENNEQLALNDRRLQLGDNIFYNNLEVKNVREGIENLRPSRTNGLLVSDGGDFLIYNTQNRLLLWTAGPENTYSYYARMLMDQWSSPERKRKIHTFQMQKKPMIVLGKPDALVRLCTEKNVQVQIAKGKPLLSVQNVDTMIYPVLSTSVGIAMLHFLTSSQINLRSEKILQELNPDLKKDKYQKKYRDGYLEKKGEQIGICNFILPDISKLSAFVKHELTGIPMEREYLAEIYCIKEYEWYVKAVIEFYRNEFAIKYDVSECIRVYSIDKELLFS